MSFSISSAYSRLQSVLSSTPQETLPAPEIIKKATASLPTSLPSHGLGDEATAEHLLSDITPGFNGPKTTGNYYGFVVGGVFPIAEVADNIVTAFDQNVQVHLPEQSISTAVEDRASSMLVELLGACSMAGVRVVQVLTAMGHSSLYKAASVVGIGRGSVKDIAVDSVEPWRIDIERLERELAREKDGVVSIVVLSAGEVNTGRFATDGRHEMEQIRKLCDQYGAWLHVDGAFGLFARTLPQTPEFAALHRSCEGLELADSITGDGHKMLNVPYDCGFFLTRSLSTLNSVFQNPNAAYLSSGISSIPSPLNHGLENSRRFRALPVYAVLLAYGRDGLSEMLVRQVRLARSIARFLDAHEGYERVAKGKTTTEESIERTHIVVIFKAKNSKINGELVGRINGTRKVYVSGTKWDGEPACRFAVSTWKVDVERDLELIKTVLEGAIKE